MTVHTALRDLPDLFRDEGVNVVELTGWLSNEQGYYWVDAAGFHHGYNGDPNGWMWHHTATNAYTPYVKNRAGQTKANIWLGISRNGRLWSFGNGPVVAVMASGGPADYSAGAGRIQVLRDYVVQDRRFEGPQRAADTLGFYGNRYYGNTEIIHPGDGSPLDAAVWEAAVKMAVVMSRRFGWSPWRHIAHEDHTKRKIDPRFAQGAPYTIGAFQDEVQRRLVTAPPPPPSNMEAALMSYADTLSLEDWAMTLAQTDIDRHFDLKIQGGNRQIWKDRLPKSPSNPGGTRTWAQLDDEDRAAWENYRRTLSARTPYYT